MLERMEKKKPEGHLEYKCSMNFKDNNIHCFQLHNERQTHSASYSKGISDGRHSATKKETYCNGNDGI